MKNITTYSDPKLQDAVVQTLNTAISAYVEHSYGIAHMGYDEDGNSYPSIYYNDASEKSFMLFPDNKVKSFCFWEFDGADVLNDSEGVNYNLSFIFWGNLERINPAKKYDFTSELEQSIVQIFVDKGATDVSYVQDGVFDKYSKYSESTKQTLMRPNSGFKITFNIHDLIC